MNKPIFQRTPAKGHEFFQDRFIVEDATADKQMVVRSKHENVSTFRFLDQFGEDTKREWKMTLKTKSFFVGDVNMMSWSKQMYVRAAWLAT